MKNIFIFSFLSIILFSCNHTKNMDLSGKWSVCLDSADVGMSQSFHNRIFPDVISLPGTTDDAGMGIPDTLSPALTKPQLTHLQRKNSFIGPVWYAREIEIPGNWDGKDIVLSLERVIWHTQVWVDDKQVSVENESLVAPHVFDLTSYLTPGKKHILTLRIDNRKRYNISVDNQLLAHAYTNHTQIIWNGAIGKIELEAKDKLNIDYVQITPDFGSKAIQIDMTVNNNTGQKTEGDVEFSVKSKYGKDVFEKMNKTVSLNPGINTIRYAYPLGNKVVCWDEFTPEVYTLSSVLKGNKCCSENTSDFGFRKIEKKGSILTINDRPLFLRGTLECAIFPLTGTPPMTHEGWEKVFSAAKKWGMNHLRFHSWCPPKAAFEVADKMGFYLQVELPIWSTSIKEEDENTQFIRSEGNRMIAEYGNHPSFCFWSLGNELQANFDVLTDILLDLKKKDSRHLYTTTSFTFEKGHGDWPEPNDDFFITQWTKKGWVRGQGVFNSFPPSFDKDYNKAVDSMSVPLITHEIGQYSVYPNMKEIEKYTGVLKPLNFISIREDLKKKGLLEKASQYTLASGKLAAILYKEEIERAMKTAGISGYQLLDLHDFPGQGTALVGLLDAFWDSKGVETPEHFTQFAAPIVPLLRFEKATYSNTEKFEAAVEISNYGKDEISSKQLSWKLSDNTTVIAQGTVDIKQIKWGHNAGLGNIIIPLNKIQKATKLNLRIALDGTKYENDWNIWVYPANQEVSFGEIKYTRELSQAKQWLEKGEKVLFNPDWRKLKGIEGKFLPVFWSPVHFPKQAGTMGILCDPTHPALQDFPTDIHTDWQWWDLCTNSTTMIIDSVSGITPIVELIDNFANNRRLASLFEGKYKNGKFILATFDLNNDLDKRPVAKQMLYSILKYMNSDKFSPKGECDIDILNKHIDNTKTSKGKEAATSIY